MRASGFPRLAVFDVERHFAETDLYKLLLRMLECTRTIFI